jgi:hypothetical protein
MNIPDKAKKTGATEGNHVEVIDFGGPQIFPSSVLSGWTDSTCDAGNVTADEPGSCDSCEVVDFGSLPPSVVRGWNISDGTVLASSAQTSENLGEKPDEAKSSIRATATVPIGPLLGEKAANRLTPNHVLFELSCQTPDAEHKRIFSRLSQVCRGGGGGGANGNKL